jgi:hypothetical protein
MPLTCGIKYSLAFRFDPSNFGREVSIMRLILLTSVSSAIRFNCCLLHKLIVFVMIEAFAALFCWPFDCHS